MITEMPTQEELEAQRDKWLKYGLCTDPCNRERAEEAVRLAYRCADLKEPKEFIWTDSPYAAMKRVKELGGDHRYCCYGSMDAGWLSFYDFFLNRPQMEGIDCIKGLVETGKECGWFWPFEELVVMSDRPAEIHRDERHNLHNTEGMAVRYRDDWGVYAVRGVRVPGWVVEEKEKITPETVEKENNAEIKRVMIEFLGWEAYLEESGAKKIQQDKYGVLLEHELDGIRRRFVRVKDGYDEPISGKPKEYIIPVPPDTRTCRDGVAWTYFMTGEEYEKELELRT